VGEVFYGKSLATKEVPTAEKTMKPSLMTNLRLFTSSLRA
jgi:hypothetical protein